MGNARNLSGLKVLHIANTGFFIQKLLSGKLEALANAGLEIHTAAPPSSIDLGSNFHPLRIAREISLFSDIASVSSCVRLLKREHFDLVHTHSSKAGFVGRLAAKCCCVPCVHTVHGLPFYKGQNRLHYNIYLNLERMAAKWSAALLSQNKEDAQTMRFLHFLPDNRIFVEGNGVHVESLAALAQERSAVRKELGIAENEVAIAFFARLEPVKGHLVFLRAFEQVYARFPNAVALFAGANFGRQSDYAALVHTELSRSPASKGIRLLGYRDDAQRVLAGCDIVALASQKEGIPRILMEGMALGRPCAATDVTGTSELVLHNVTGLLSSANDSNLLAASLCALVESEDLRIRLGAAAKKRAKEEFDEKDVIERILDAYAFVCTAQ